MLNIKFINLIMVLHFPIVWKNCGLELMNDLFAKKRILNIFYLYLTRQKKHWILYYRKRKKYFPNFCNLIEIWSIRETNRKGRDKINDESYRTLNEARQRSFHQVVLPYMYSK